MNLNIHRVVRNIRHKLSKDWERTVSGLLIGAHAWLCLAGVNRWEFFGEDEVWTAITNARVILGIVDADSFNLAALLTSPHPPLRNILQIPFLLALGMKEVSIYLPGTIASVTVLLILRRIARGFLSRLGLLILTAIYTASAAYAINRSPNGHGWLIVFLLAAFAFSLRWRQDRRIQDLTFAWFMLALATLTYLDGLLFAPYLLWVTFAQPEGLVGFRKRAASVLAYLLPLGLYAALFLWLPLTLVGHPVGNLAHLLQRQGGVQLSFGKLLDIPAGYYHTFNPILSIIMLASVFYAIASWRKLPGALVHLGLFWVLHFFTWTLLFQPECGHTLYAYPFFILATVWFAQESWRRLAGKHTQAIFAAGVFSVLLGVSMVYNFSIFNDPAPRKAFLGCNLFKDRLPCGVNYAHQIGLKSAAYLIRQESGADELYLGDTGGSMNLFYLDRADATIGLKTLLDQLAETPDPQVISSYHVRYIGLYTGSSGFSQRKALLDRILSPGIVVVDEEGSVLLVVWDRLAQKDDQPQVLQVDQFRREFDVEYSHLRRRLASWIDTCHAYFPGDDAPASSPINRCSASYPRLIFMDIIASNRLVVLNSPLLLCIATC